jgi:hypothetical protein
MRDWIGFIAKHWKVAAAALPSLLLCAVAYGRVAQTVQSIDDRVTWIEGTHPEGTAALVSQGAADALEIRKRLDRLSDDASATRADVARLCDHFGLPSH